MASSDPLPSDGPIKEGSSTPLLPLWVDRSVHVGAFRVFRDGDEVHVEVFPAGLCSGRRSMASVLWLFATCFGLMGCLGGVLSGQPGTALMIFVVFCVPLGLLALRAIFLSECLVVTPGAVCMRWNVLCVRGQTVVDRAPMLHVSRKLMSETRRYCVSIKSTSCVVGEGVREHRFGRTLSAAEQLDLAAVVAGILHVPSEDELRPPISKPVGTAVEIEAGEQHVRVFIPGRRSLLKVLLTLTVMMIPLVMADIYATNPWTLLLTMGVLYYWGHVARLFFLEETLTIKGGEVSVEKNLLGWLSVETIPRQTVTSMELHGTTRRGPKITYCFIMGGAKRYGFGVKLMVVEQLWLLGELQKVLNVPVVRLDVLPIV